MHLRDSPIISRIANLDYNKIFLLGGPDSGKTTFAVALASEISKSEPVSLIDTDIGQSTIGPPTTLASINVKKGEGKFWESEADSYYFAGDITPVKFMLPVLAGSCKLSGQSQTKQIIDSSGLISYPFGTILKYQKLMAIRPDLVIAFQRGKELEELLSTVDNFVQIKRLAVSKDLPKRTPAQRAGIRKKKFAVYFKGSSSRNLDLTQLSVYPSRLKLGIDYLDLTVGLIGSKDTLGIGVIKEINGAKIKVATPVTENIKGIIIGNLKINESGEQLGRLR